MAGGSTSQEPWSPEWICVSVAVFFFFLALEGELMLSVLKLLVMDILKLMGSFAPEVPSAYLWCVRAHPVVLPGAALSSLHLHGSVVPSRNWGL